MSQRLRLTVNGESREYAPDAFPASVLELIQSLELDAGMVVAEVNGDIVRRQGFADRVLDDGDTVELVRFVGGG